MTDAILQVRGLQKYFGGLAAVDDVSLEVRVGEVHAVIGPNGAGKTTLIDMLSGDLAPTAGSTSTEALVNALSITNVKVSVEPVAPVVPVAIACSARTSAGFFCAKGEGR